MTDTAKKPTDDSKEELTEAELDQVAGGVGREAHPALRHAEPSPGLKTHEAIPGVNAHTEPEKIPQPATTKIGGA
jgi:hypothetical protein